MFSIIGRVGRRVIERKSYVVLIACFGIIFGVILHSFFNYSFDFFWIYNLLLLAGILVLMFWKDKNMRLIFIGVFFLIAGFARFDLGIEKNNILPKFYNKEIKIIGIVNEEPINKIDKQQLVIKPININREDIKNRERILVTSSLYPKYNYGDKLEIICKLIKPKKYDTFDYARYLSVENIYGLCYYPLISFLSFLGTPIMTDLFQAKTFLIEKINQSLHEPFASFLSGLILGARNAIPPEILNNFQRTGTTHIVAISGWNITFLGLIFLPVLFRLRLNRRQAFYVMTGLVVLFVLLVGAQASVVRAGIMGILALYAKAFSRYNHAGRALLYSIVLMFLINTSIVYDVGFWLSVSATFGLIYFSPIVENITKIKEIRFKLVKENLITTVSAVIFTLPISSFVFGHISLWALPVNLIILPFIAYAIIAALLALPFAIVLPQIFAQIILLPSTAILNFIVKVINLFGNIPFGYLPLKVNFIVMLGLYAVILYFTFFKLKKINEKD